MNLLLKFKNIEDCNGLPRIRISINNTVLFDNVVCPLISVVYSETTDKVNLRIEHYDKDANKDTVVENGVIVKDRSCELDAVEVDGYNFEELKWRSVYQCDDGTMLDQCLFFGKNGVWSINFDLPVLKWILSTRHEINQNDPTWLEDYESYVQSCKLINKLI